MTVRDVLDQRNFWAWEILQDKFTILQTWHENKMIDHQINDHVIQLHLPKEGLCYEAFTHELLRIYLRAIEGIYLPDYLVLKWHEKPLFHWFFNSPSLFETIGKKLEDSRIYHFLVKNAIEINCSDEESRITACHLDFLEGQPKKEKCASPFVSLFLQRFFSTSATSLFGRDYLNTVERLERLNQDLFSIANHFYQSWKQLDIRSPPSNKTYHLCADDFMYSLFSWALRNMKLPQYFPD